MFVGVQGFNGYKKFIEEKHAERRKEEVGKRDKGKRAS